MTTVESELSQGWDSLYRNRESTGSRYSLTETLLRGHLFASYISGLPRLHPNQVSKRRRRCADGKCAFLLVSRDHNNARDQFRQFSPQVNIRQVPAGVLR